MKAVRGTVLAPNKISAKIVVVMQTLPLALGLLATSLFAYAIPQLIFGVFSVWSRVFGTIFFFIVVFVAITIIIKNSFRAKWLNVLNPIFQNVQIIQGLTFLVFFSGLYTIYLGFTASEGGEFALIFGLPPVALSIAQLFFIYKTKYPSIQPSQTIHTEAGQRKFSGLSIAFISVGATIAILVLFFLLRAGLNYTEYLAYSLTHSPLPTGQPDPPLPIEYLEVRTAGCESDSCIVVRSEGGSDDKLPLLLNSYNNKIQPSTAYEVTVCKPNCQSGTYVSVWKRKQCFSTKEGTLTLHVSNNTCY